MNPLSFSLSFSLSDASIQPRTGQDKFNVGLGIANADLGAFLSPLPTPIRTSYGAWTLIANLEVLAHSSSRLVWRDMHSRSQNSDKELSSTRFEKCWSICAGQRRQNFNLQFRVSILRNPQQATAHWSHISTQEEARDSSGEL